jgi:transcription antitermination factor NusG
VFRKSWIGHKRTVIPNLRGRIRELYPQSEYTLQQLINFCFGVTTMEHRTEACDPDSSWYAVRTRSRQEKVSAAMLSALGVYRFLPLKSEVRQWSDRKQSVETPLFSGYLFVRMNLLTERRVHVLQVPGVISFVGNHTGPLPIPDRQIEDIQTVLAARPRYSVQPLFKAGDPVRVVRGVLSGVEGKLVRTISECRLLISIDMIRQCLAVNVSPDDVELIGEPSVHPACFEHSKVVRAERMLGV